MSRLDAAEPRQQTREELIATFLGFACWDHHEHGKADHRLCDAAARRLLAHHPEIARDSLYTAIVCGDREHVEHLLAQWPEAAGQAGGPRGWTPLLYLCYARMSHPPTSANAVAIARALLDRGANPNDFYMAGDARYSALVGTAGEGEQDSPRQPQGPALFQLLLERGAEPFDIQVLYNTHFSGDVLWWLEMVYAHTSTTERKAAWADANWTMLDMGGYGCGARFLLELAIGKRNRRLGQWLLEHGANPNAAPASGRRRPTGSLHQEAVKQGVPELAALLVQHGAAADAPVLTDSEQLIDAAFRQNRHAAHQQLTAHPEFLQSTDAIFAAAREDRADAVAFLLEIGVKIEVADRTHQRTLHVAASRHALRVAQFLIDRGAEIDPVELHYSGTPISFASHCDDVEMMDLLSKHSRHVWTLAFRGYVDRLRQVLAAEPERARAVRDNGITPLWWLPDDEEKATAIVELLLAHGADPKARNANGNTAAAWARKRGMLDIARRLES